MTQDNSMEHKIPTISKTTVLGFVIEFGPLLLFFLVFEFFNFMTSVIILVIAVVLALCASIFIQKRIAIFPLFSSGSVVVFGLATVFLHDPNFIIFKDTLFYGIFGTFILIALSKGNLLLKKLFTSIFAITDVGWRIVSLRWGIFMILLALSNEIARIYFSADEWVLYKMGTLVVLTIFSGWQFLLSRKERLPEANSWGLRA